VSHDQTDPDEHALRATMRHAGRTYGVIAYPNGSSSLDVDGRFICNADWNGRVLDTGLNEVHRDRRESDRILTELANELRRLSPPDEAEDATPDETAGETARED